MIHLLADENFNNRILRGVWRKNPEANITRVQDTDMYEAPDPTLPEWAAQNKYVLLSHDADTLPGFAYDRVNVGLPMTGIILVERPYNYEVIIENLLLIIGASEIEDWVNRVEYLPL